MYNLLALAKNSFEIRPIFLPLCWSFSRNWMGNFDNFPRSNVHVQFISVLGWSTEVNGTFWVFLLLQLSLSCLQMLKPCRFLSSGSLVVDFLRQRLQLQTLGTPLFGFKIKLAICFLADRIAVAVYIAKRSSDNVSFLQLRGCRLMHTFWVGFLDGRPRHRPSARDETRQYNEELHHPHQPETRIQLAGMCLK